MKTWNGLPLYVCSVCGWATVNPAAFAEHERISGHKEPEKVVKPVLEVEPEKPEIKKRKAKSTEIVEDLETISEGNNE